MNKAKFVLYKSKMLEKYEEIKELCDEVSYSAKTNYVVAKQLEKLTDCSLSVHAQSIVEKIEDRKRIWFFAQAWDKQEIQELLEAGVRRFVVDNEEDLQELLTTIEEVQTEVEVMLRARLQERTIHTGKYYVYGMYAKQINALIPEVAKHAHVKTVGVHAHRKSQNISEWSLQHELEEILSEEVLQCISYVNIGGGIPATYKNFRAPIRKRIYQQIQKLRGWLHEKDVQLIIEPGRIIAAPCIELHATIKNVYDNNIIVNCSVYNSALDTFIANHKLLIQGELPDKTGQAYTVKGYTPCSADMFRYRAYLENPQKGDAIVFLNAGAYNFCSDFCDLKQLETEIRE